MTEQPSTLIFSRNWDIYRQVIANNYMWHREIAAYLTESFSDVAKGDAIRVLDLGCGDAAQIAPVLKLKQVDQYTGYDMSQPALDFAGINMQDLPAKKKFVNGQMEVLIENETDEFEIIYSSYAIHHLPDSGKKQLLADCCRRLSKGGIIIIIDIFRNENQTRSEYTERYITWMRENWPAIAPADLELLWDHIRQFDFPAAPGNIIEWAAGLGLKVIRQASPDERHCMLTLKRD